MQSTYRVKVISMGNAGTGKSCIIKRYCEKRFINKYLSTIGIDYGMTKLTLKSHELKVNIFDMAGDPLFYEVRNEFYRDVQGALLVFDVSDKTSFAALDGWLDELHADSTPQTQSITAREARMKPVEFVVVCANKVDKKREVSTSEGESWANAHRFAYIETSAMTGEGVSKAFETLFAGIVERIERDSAAGDGAADAKEPPAGTVQTGRKSPTATREQLEVIQRVQKARDDFERLGIAPNSSKDEINRAFRRLALLLHPDKNPAPGAADAFKLLVTAHNALVER